MLKKGIALILIAVACVLPMADLSARGGGGHGGGGHGGGFHGGGGRGFHGGGFHGGGRGWGDRGWGGRGYWGGRGWGWGGYGLGLGFGLGWGWPYYGGYWGYPYWGGYPWWGYRSYSAYPWWAYSSPYSYPAYQAPAYQTPNQQQPQTPEYVRDSTGQTFWAITNQAPFPIKIATDSEVVVLNPGEQKSVNRGFDFTFTAEGGGASRQFSSRDHTINLDAASFGMQPHRPIHQQIDPAYLTIDASATKVQWVQPTDQKPAARKNTPNKHATETLK